MNIAYSFQSATGDGSWCAVCWFFFKTRLVNIVWLGFLSPLFFFFSQMLRAHNDFFASAFVLLKLVSLLHVYKVGSFPLEIVLVIENRQLSVPIQHSFLLCCLGIRLNQYAVKKTRQESQFGPSSYSFHSTHRETLKWAKPSEFGPRKCTLKKKKKKSQVLLWIMWHFTLCFKFL